MPPSCETLKTPALWIQRTSLSHLAQRRHAIPHGLCVFGTLLVVPRFWGRTCPWALLNEQLYLLSVPARWPPFFLLTFFSYHAGKFYIFPTHCQLRLFASRIFIACLAYTNRLVREMVMTQRIEPLSRNVIFMILLLNLLVELFCIFKGFNCTYTNRFFSFSCYLSWNLSLPVLVVTFLPGRLEGCVPWGFRQLHDIAESTCTSNSFLAFFMLSLNSMSSGSI